MNLINILRSINPPSFEPVALITFLSEKNMEHKDDTRKTIEDVAKVYGFEFAEEILQRFKAAIQNPEVPLTEFMTLSYDNLGNKGLDLTTGGFEQLLNLLVSTGYFTLEMKEKILAISIYKESYSTLYNNGNPYTEKEIKDALAEIKRQDNESAIETAKNQRLNKIQNASEAARKSVGLNYNISNEMLVYTLAKHFLNEEQLVQLRTTLSI